MRCGAGSAEYVFPAGYAYCDLIPRKYTVTSFSSMHESGTGPNTASPHNEPVVGSLRQLTRGTARFARASKDEGGLVGGRCRYSRGSPGS